MILSALAHFQMPLKNTFHLYQLYQRHFFINTTKQAFIQRIRFYAKDKLSV
jgi:hypothetical protein